MSLTTQTENGSAYLEMASRRAIKNRIMIPESANPISLDDANRETGWDQPHSLARSHPINHKIEPLLALSFLKKKRGVCLRFALISKGSKTSTFFQNLNLWHASNLRKKTKPFSTT